MQSQHYKFSGGYTLLEVLIVIVVLGILSAIAAPSWLAFLTRQRLNTAQTQALTVMREAQSNAKRQKRVWEACFQNNDTEKKVQWSVQPFKQDGEICQNARWQNIIGADTNTIAVDKNSSARSTLYNKNNIYRVQFNDKGWVNGQLGKITFTAQNGSNSSKRCVVVSTLLGVTRAVQNNECNGD